MTTGKHMCTVSRASKLCEQSWMSQRSSEAGLQTGDLISSPSCYSYPFSPASGVCCLDRVGSVAITGIPSSPLISLILHSTAARARVEKSGAAALSHTGRYQHHVTQSVGTACTTMNHRSTVTSRNNRQMLWRMGYIQGVVPLLLKWNLVRKAHMPEKKLCTGQVSLG